MSPPYMFRVDLSLRKFYSTLPDELKLEILGYVLHPEYRELDLLSSPKCLDRGRCDALRSPKFQDSEIVKEVFYRINTFYIAPAATGNNVFVIPPEQYRKFIRHIHISIHSTERDWAILSDFKLKAHFPRLTSLTVTVDFDFSRSRGLCPCRRDLKSCYRCKSNLEVRTIEAANGLYRRSVRAPHPAEAKALAYLKNVHAQDQFEQSVV